MLHSSLLPSIPLHLPLSSRTPSPATAQYDIAGLFGAVPLNATSYKGLQEGITGVQPEMFNKALQVCGYAGSWVQTAATVAR